MLRNINITSVLLAGIFYALFSKVWFADFFLGRIYRGVFREDFFSPSQKVRSALIRFIAGALIGFVIDTIIIVAEISSIKAAAQMGLLLSIVPTVVSFIQLFYQLKQGRIDMLLEMAFQVLSIEIISLLMVILK